MADYYVENETISKGGDKECSTKTSKRSFLKSINFKKIAGLKSLLMILVLLVVAVILYNVSGFSTMETSSGSDKIGYTTSLQYVREIEAKLNEIIGNIKGAGNVNVMLSINSSPELQIAENTEEKTVTTSSGTTTTKTYEMIIVKSNGEEVPLVLKETLPVINGVIVVSSGANDVKVRLDILTAVSTALGINPNKIEVFVGE